MFVSTNAIFLEYDYMTNYKPRNKVVIEELLSDEIIPQPTTVVQRQNKEATSIHQDPLSIRRSGRVIKPPTRYNEDGMALVAITDNDPLTYKHAMEDPDKERWLEAMNLEMESMYSNSVWELVDLPNEVRPIGCKWIYKRKRGVDGKVETLKARLVAKGYT